MVFRVQLFVICFLFLSASKALCQENYEIQVYGSETMPEGRTMIELHSNFTASGEKAEVNGVRPTNKAFHETLEITHGFTPWFETGLYLFTSARSGDGLEWVGSHIRPRVRAPETWDLPVGLSLSAEFGYQRRSFSENTWSIELRPIIDKEIGRVYLCFNPTVEKALDGSSSDYDFSPNIKVSYDITPVITLGVEYYGSLGPIGNFSAPKDQQHQLYPSVDLNVSPDWELNFGVGFGLTKSTDPLIIKTIVGIRI